MKGKQLPLQVAGLLMILALCIGTGCKPNLDFDPGPEPTRDPVLETSIIQELENLDPGAVDIYQEATQAGDEGDLEKSYDLFVQLVDMVPGFSTAYRRLSYLESYLGNSAEAVEAARKAVELDPNGYNKSALAYALLDEGTPKSSREAFNLASSAAEELPDDEQVIFVLMLSAWLAFEEDVMRESNQQLLEIYPVHPLVHYVAGIIAASDGKWFKAERELLISEQLGMPPEVIQELMDGGIARNLKLIRTMIWGGAAILIWLIGLAILYVAGVLLSKATLKELNEEMKQVRTSLTRKERNLRSNYRTVIRILSAYFYVSIPFMILLVLVVAGGAYIIFSMIGFIPIYAVGLLGVILLVTLIAIVGSLTRRVKDTPPGILLDRIRVPEIWSMNDDIARKLDVRPVDKIYLTSGVGIAVSESGSFFNKILGKGIRNLILGMGVLPGLTKGQFTAVLAHEYGHFSNQDTAGGNLAYRVYASLDQLARQLVRGGAAWTFNPVWLFVVAYQKVYLRVTLGAKRLQEVLADRYAALSMGSDILIAGLTNIVKEAIRFNLIANHEIKNSLEKKIGLNNLYGLPMNDDLNTKFEEIYTKRLEEKTSDFDSHPALQERIDRIKSYRIPDRAIRDGDLPMLDLIPDVEELQQKLTQELTDQIPGL